MQRLNPMLLAHLMGAVPGDSFAPPVLPEDRSPTVRTVRRRFKPGRSGPYNRTQENARRRRQIERGIRSASPDASR